MDELTCKSVRASLWDYEAGALRTPVAGSVATHLVECRECGAHRAEVKGMRIGLRQLPVMQPPPVLQTRLQVLASRERSRRLARIDFNAWLKDKSARLRLSFNNLLKPFAVPAAGGLLASFICFGILVDTLHVRPEWDVDMPIGVYTEVAIDEVSPFSSVGRDVMVQLTVDADGHVTDYFVPQGTVTPQELQDIGNLILYSTFTPAVRMGRRVPSKFMFYISHMNVKG